MPPGRAPLLLGALLVLSSGAGMIWLVQRFGLLGNPPLWMDVATLGAMVLGWLLVVVGVISIVRGTLAREAAARDDRG